MATKTEVGTLLKQAIARGDRAEVMRLVANSETPPLREMLQMVRDNPSGVAHAREVATQAARQAVPILRTHATDAAAAMRADNRTPTVMHGDRPGGLRWMLIVLGLIALAVWLLFAHL